MEREVEERGSIIKVFVDDVFGAHYEAAGR